MLVRVDNGRDGIETCSAANVGYRIYVAKNKGSTFEKNERNVQDFVIKAREEFNRIGAKKKLDRCDPIRVLIYWNDADDFFTMIFAFKFTSAETSKFAKINELRYLLARYVFELYKYDNSKQHLFYITFVNSSDIHKATAGFDAVHCDEGPVKDIEGKALKSYLEKDTSTGKKNKTKDTDREDSSPTPAAGGTTPAAGDTTPAAEDTTPAADGNDGDQNKRRN